MYIAVVERDGWYSCGNVHFTCLFKGPFVQGTDTCTVQYYPLIKFAVQWTSVIHVLNNWAQYHKNIYTTELSELLFLLCDQFFYYFYYFVLFIIKFSLMIKLSMHHSEFEMLMVEFMKACLLSSFTCNLY